jgi:hypothetical protein
LHGINILEQDDLIPELSLHVVNSNLNILYQQPKGRRFHALLTVPTLTSSNNNLPILPVDVLESGPDQTIAVVQLEHPVPRIGVKVDIEWKLHMLEASVRRITQVLVRVVHHR